MLAGGLWQPPSFRAVWVRGGRQAGVGNPPPPPILPPPGAVAPRCHPLLCGSLSPPLRVSRPGTWERELAPTWRGDGPP